MKGNGDAYRRPSRLTQTANRIVSWFASLGLTPSDTVTLEVKGRRSRPLPFDRTDTDRVRG
jgi:hypothetical protein